MPNGAQGDHPLTDILQHDTEVYGKETDELIRKIALLSSRRELYEWWEREINWSTDKVLILSKSKLRHQELANRAKSSGWEIKE